MSNVYNWQLGRQMSYPYEESHPDWQFAFVFNTNRCIGCQTCTMACKSTWTFARGQELMWWNNVETKPYGGYPQFWDAKLLKMLHEADPEGQRWKAGAAGRNGAGPYGKFEGKTIFEASETNKDPKGPQVALGYLPSDDEWTSPNIHEETAAGRVRGPNDWTESVSLPEHKVWYFHLARICNHCTYPGCLAACPRQAIYKRKEDGIVLIDQNRCRGYRKCVEACPYKKAMYQPVTRVSEKCVGCYPRIEGKDETLSQDGQPLETRCMSACVGKIRLQGLVKIDKNGQWSKDPENPLYYLIRERRVALPLYPQFGTEPNGYYIPPRWAPRAYLEQMFGPGVEHAIEQYVCPDRDFTIEKGPKVAEVEVTMPSGQARKQEIFNDTVIGYNKAGKEVIRTTVEEPTFERAPIHLNSI